MKSGFPFLRALAAWTVQKMRGPLLAMVFLLLGVAVASSVTLCRCRRGDREVPRAKIYPLLSKPCEFFVDNSCNAPAEISRSAGIAIRFGKSEENSSPDLNLAHEEV